MIKFRFGSTEHNSCHRDWNDPERFELKETIVQAPSIQDALEHFCSTCTELESHIGRVVRYSPEPETVPKGYNMAGQKVDLKPCLPETKGVPDDKIIQVWQGHEDDPDFEDWFYGKWKDAQRRTGYPFSLVFELPLSDVWKYDKWGNVDHPALPAPESGSLELTTDLADLNTFKGRTIRSFSRADISRVRRALKAKKNELDMMTKALSDSINKLNTELEFRGQQLRYLTLYMGRNVEIILINKGQKAPDTELVHIRQRVLYMAEEVGSIQWEVGFDFRNIEDFDRWVVKPENLSIITPEPKCIVFLKPRRSDADYGDPLINWFMNEENRKVYVLLRNGETVYRAQLDIDIPDRLFPEEEKFERELERERENKIETFWDSDFHWEWESYAEKWKAREEWYKKGFTDADFEDEIDYRTKEEMLVAKEKAKAKYEAEKLHPKEHVEVSDWDMERIYKRYNDDLKQYFFALAFIQGVFDRTDIFGHLQGKINVFTGLGLNEHAKLIYDMSEQRLLEDKDTPSLVAWLKTEANKVKVGDYVIMRGAINRGYDKPVTYVNGVARVIKVKAPGMIAARMDRDSWRYWDDGGSEERHGIIHRLRNGDRDGASGISFYPWNLPMDKLRFYVERRAERDKYWDSLIVDLLRLKMAIIHKEKPKIGKVRVENRIEEWREERPERC